ncbi:DivIVA domain-containing protein [Raoultibacter massiliensis]|uniref:Cell wall synthesis protein Wag31 n=1 Tax=Raoultibacter massiliensis TaxID=1852371 RepID=A0ABV1JDS8_9ACTN|nr:DivIVA domain-containing protein [Raoultibacter massiliensis]
MAMTSADIQNQSFSIDRKGYDVDEVDVFLEHVANELDEMNAFIDQLQGELDDNKFGGFDRPARNVAAASNDELAEKDARIAELERQLEEKKADGNAIAQALIIAQRSGDEIIATANAEAAQTRAEAEEEAQRILDKANNEKQKIMDAIKDLEEDREDVRGEYQDLLKDFIESASKKLVEIGGPAPAPVASAHAKSASRSTTKAQAPIRKEATATAAAYTTPAASASSVVVPTTPKPSRVEKDLSGFGDADDGFEFEEID